jgi:Terminase large subunit, T4likevirus-type, N-terminal
LSTTIPPLPPLPPKKTAKVRKPTSTQEHKRIVQETKKEQAKAAKAIAKAEAALEEKRKAQAFLERQQEVLTKKSGVIKQEELPPEAIEVVKKKVAFEPNSDKQIWFLQAAEDEVLFSGGRGSGKSLCLIADPLRYIENPNFRAVIIRRTMPELKELIGRAKDMYFQIVPTVQWKVKDNLFLFPSGATIEFGYLDSENDLEKYRGQEFCVAVDTLITMADGSPKRIVDIKVGDFVATLEGARKVTHTTRPYMAPCVKLKGKGVSQVQPIWHPVLTEEGWQSYASVRGICSKEFEDSYQVTQQHPSVYVNVKRAARVPLLANQYRAPTEYQILSDTDAQKLPDNLKSLQHLQSDNFGLQQDYEVLIENQGQNLVYVQYAQESNVETDCSLPQDSLSGYSSYPHLYDGQSQGVLNTYQGASPLLGDAVAHTPAYQTLGVLDNTLVGNHQREDSYLHPYALQEIKTSWDSVLTACELSFVGYELVADITVESANLYITHSQGIVNKNTAILIDEISQIPFQEWYYKLKASLRSSDPTLRPYARSTSNPTGVGRDWVREYFRIGEKPANTTIRETFDTPMGKVTTTKKWIHSTVFDNPDLLKANPQYVAQLMSTTPALRKAWLDGDWDAIEGAAFQEFDKAIHVCDPFPIPQEWTKVKGSDYGYKDGASCVWVAIDPVTDIRYVYREFYCNQRTAEVKDRLDGPAFSQKVKATESGEYVKYGVLDSSCWATRGQTGPTIAEEMIKAGVKWRPSDKGPGSRIAGKNKIHQLLKVDEFTGKPGLIFFNNCVHSIKSMAGIPIDKHNAEDVDTDSPLDCTYDALRYVLMSRPTGSQRHWDTSPPPPINSTFGY